MRNKTVIVTGCAGFIGSHVCQHLLDAGHSVIGLDDLSGGFIENVPNEVCFYKGSTLNHEMVDSIFQHHSPTHVIHLAAYATEGLSFHIRRFNYLNNLVSTVNLINAAVNHGVEGFTFTSSMSVYGDQTPPFTEDMPTKPVDPYAVAKDGAEKDLRIAGDVHGLKWCIIRPYSVYGPKQNIADAYRNVAGIHMNQALRGEPLTIFGSGEQRRAFSYISEVAPVIAATVDRDVWGQVFNVGGSLNYSINHLAESISQAMGVEHKVVHLPPRHEVAMAWCDNRKTKDTFPDLFKPVPLSAGLELMAEWAKKRGPQTCKPFANIEILKNLHPKWRKLIQS